MHDLEKRKRNLENKKWYLQTVKDLLVFKYQTPFGENKQKYQDIINNLVTWYKNL